MINRPTMLPCRVSLSRAAFASGWAALLLSAWAWPALAQTDNFNDGNVTSPTTWYEYSLPNIPAGIPPYNLPADYFAGATYSFPADGSGGLAYSISAPGITFDPLMLGNTRAGAWPTSPTYSIRFSVASDLLAWSTAGRPNMGLLWYFHDVGYGTSDGYAATYSPSNQNLYISVVNGEAQEYYFCKLNDGDTALQAGDRVRLVASSHDGSTFVFSIYNLKEPNTVWASAVGSDSLYFGIPGFCGYLIMNEDYPSPDAVSAVFDNYSATSPAAGTMPAMVTDVYPPPAGKSHAEFSSITNRVTILNRDTAVDYSSILLSLDGTWIPNSSLTIDYEVIKPNPGVNQKNFPGAIVSYGVPGLLPWGSKHTNVVVFSDTVNWYTNTWTWTANYTHLFASNSLPIGSLNVRGFDVRMAQTTNGGVNLANSLERARQQLDGLIPVDQRATGIVQVLNWNKEQPYPNNVPGLCQGVQTEPINIAVETCAYLELKAGLHRFHINTDDRAGFYSGVNLADNTAVWEAPGNTANAFFELVVEADGLYPVRCLWEETGGSASLALRNVMQDATEILINDSADPTGVVKAWYPLVCKSASSITGPFAVATSAVNVLNQVDVYGTGDCGGSVVGQRVIGGVLTVPVSGATQFYRLDAPRATRITQISRTATTVVISYELL